MQAYIAISTQDSELPATTKIVHMQASIIIAITIRSKNTQRGKKNVLNKTNKQTNKQTNRQTKNKKQKKKQKKKTQQQQQQKDRM